jgi:hypothetical protein
MENKSTVQQLIEELENTLVRSIFERLEREGIFTRAIEKEYNQHIRDYNAGYDDAQCNHINDAENYVNEIKYINSNI